MVHNRTIEGHAEESDPEGGAGSREDDEGEAELGLSAKNACGILEGRVLEAGKHDGER